MREEVNTIDSSDLFLDVFVNDDFTNYGGLLTLEHDDATSYPQDGPVSVAQQPLPPRLMTKSRFTRWRLENKVSTVCGLNFQLNQIHNYR